MASSNSPPVADVLPDQIPVVNDLEELCTACSKIPLEFFENVGERKYDHTLRVPVSHTTAPSSLEDNSCSLCSLLLKVLCLNSTNLPQSVTNRSLILSRPPERDESVYAAHCMTARLSDQQEEVSLSFEVSSHPWGLSQMSEEADSPQVFSMVRSWISDCLQHHPGCRTPDHENNIFIPTRLVEIEPTEEKISLRLRTRASFTDSELQSIHYTALSHCWGKAHFIKTSKNNYTQFLDRIPNQALSKTFLDAVKITWNLGMKYIWIDSLCCIQDDEADMQKECATMAKIYSSALITIAAADAKDGTEGCFFPRSTSTFQCYSEDRSRVETVTVRDCMFSDWNIATSGVIGTRGWCLQERHLSPRILSLSRSRLLWECKTCFGSEEYPRLLCKSEAHSFPFDKLGNFSPFINTTPAFYRLLDPRQDQEGAWLALHSCVKDQWYEAVQDYSSRALSFATDKLPAISGLASAVSRLLPHDRYIAGIWEKDFFIGLTWTPTTRISIPGPHPISAKDYSIQNTALHDSNIPSWSWASFPGTVEYVFSDEGEQPDRFIRLDSITLETSPLNPFGRVQSARLLVTGFTHRVCISEDTAVTPEQGAELNWDWSHRKLYTMMDEVGHLGSDESPMSLGYLYLDIEVEKLERVQVLCVSLCRGGPTEDWVEFGTEERGLVVREVGTTDPGGVLTCCRIGSYVVNYERSEVWSASMVKMTMRLV